jgi:hypothetical protein
VARSTPPRCCSTRPTPASSAAWFRSSGASEERIGNSTA